MASARMVHKYTLEISSKPQTLDLPVGAEILDIQMQHGQPRLWALVDPTETEPEERVFRMTGTGWPIDAPIDENMRHVATVQADDGMLVWHFFEEVKKHG